MRRSREVKIARQKTKPRVESRIYPTTKKNKQKNLESEEPKRLKNQKSG